MFLPGEGEHQQWQGLLDRLEAQGPPQLPEVPRSLRGARLRGHVRVQAIPGLSSLSIPFAKCIMLRILDHFEKAQAQTFICWTLKTVKVMIYMWLDFEKTNMSMIHMQADIEIMDNLETTTSLKFIWLICFFCATYAPRYSDIVQLWKTTC